MFCALTASSNNLASETDRVNPPTWSSDHDTGNTPVRLTRSCVGINPTTPQYAAGRPIDPTVWLPSAAGHIFAATAAADPLLEPPGVCVRLRGLRVGPGSKVANSVVTVFPKTIAPAAF